MSIKRIDVAEFVSLANHHPIIDVRSPGEFDHAHIPGANSVPLFTDEERKIVGTTYKQESREKAIKIGLKYFGRKMVKMVEDVEALTTSKTVSVHCWRGGMRSAGVAWLLDLYGFKVYTLNGGYKAYRNWVLQQFQKEYKIQIIGGYTGSAKTYVLAALKKLGDTIIDLECLANHKGSAFGNIGMPPQPSQEMFENLLATKLAAFEKDKMIWIEDESQRIGGVNIPTVFFQQMRMKRVFFLKIPFEERLQHLVHEYGNLDKERMINAIIRIQKRLGGLETKHAVNFLIEGNIRESFSILLKYYDKWYGKSLQLRENWQQLVTTIEAENCDPFLNAGRLQQYSINQMERKYG